MAAKVVNLRQARKGKARAEKRAASAKKTGTADLDKARAELDAARLAGKRIDREADRE